MITKNIPTKHQKISNIPVYKMNEKREKIALQALKDHKNSKTHEIHDIDEFFNNL